MSKVVKKKLPNEKLSELEFEIRILELNEASLPEGEIARLKNLREKNELQKKQGWSVIKTVPVKLLERYKPKVLETEIPTPDCPHFEIEDVQNDLAKSALKRKKVAHGYNHYVNQIKLKHTQENPKEVLNMEVVRSSWKKLSPVEKIKYKEMAQEVLKNSTDATENTSKEKKMERDRKYQRKKAEVQKQDKSEIDAFTKDFENILEERKIKLDNLKQLKEELKKEITLASSENDIVNKMIADQDEEEQSLKFKIKDIFNHHKSCKK